MFYRPYFLPTWTLVFFLICLAAYFLWLTFPLDEFSFKPSEAFSKPWTLVTSIFLHAGFGHLFLNMFALLMFGSFLEERIGGKRFFILFLTAGVFGNLAYWLTSPFSEIPAVGASGATYGILGAVAILYPTLIVWFFPGIPVPMIIAAGFWVLISVIGMFIPTNIAHQAHLAGLMVGFYFGYKIREARKRYWWEYLE